MIDRILVPLDGSQLAEQAVPAASALAGKTDAEIILMTSIAPGERWAGDETSERWRENEQATAEMYLESLAERLKQNGVRVRVCVVWGRAAVAITATVDEEGADVIAMSTHGRSGLVRWVIGSVADKVLRTTRKPLLLVHAREQLVPEPVEFDRLLVPLDGSPVAESALPFVEGFAREVGASLVLEQVVVPAATLYPGEFLPSNLPVLPELEEAAKEYLSRIAKEAERAGVAAEVCVDVGYPAETILAAAERDKVDIIALSTHGRSGPERWIMGSVADAVIRHADWPCLVIPARKAVQPRVEEVEPSRTPVGIEPAPTVIPAPIITETATERQSPPHPPEERPHRPERSPGR
jgi:nucleotide-binding universal stress UspA family protein